MPDQRRIGYRWNLRKVMAARNLWKTAELQPLPGINLSDAQVHRLITGTPERIPARTLAALCDILDCEPNDLFEPFVEVRAAASANAPRRSEDIGVRPGNPIARRIRLIPGAGDEPGRPGTPGEGPASPAIRTGGLSRADAAGNTIRSRPPGRTPASAGTVIRPPSGSPAPAPAATGESCPDASMTARPAGAAAASGSTWTAPAAAPKPNCTPAGDAGPASSGRPSTGS